MQTKTDVEYFVNNWVARNVHAVPRHVSLLQEVDRLAACLTATRVLTASAAATSTGRWAISTII